MPECMIPRVELGERLRGDREGRIELFVNYRESRDVLRLLYLHLVTCRDLIVDQGTTHRFLSIFQTLLYASLGRRKVSAGA